MQQFLRGQKGKLSDLGCGASFTVTVDLAAPGVALDASCFGLDAAGKLADDRYMVFYNQTASPGDAVRLQLAGGKAMFAVDLDRLPATIDKLVFTAALDGNATMRALNPGAVQVADAVRFPLQGSDFQDEKAVILAELYRKDGVWRLAAVGQGFNGGLSALLAHFGGAEAASAAPAAAPTAAPTAAPAAPKVSLSKVTLEKRGDKVSLEKQAGKGYGRIHVNLNWNQGTAPASQPGFLARLAGAKASRGIDLDLGCMFELANGAAGVVQALGNAWGSYERAPFIHLAGDDRSGSVADGENIGINGAQFDQIRRALIYAFIYEGVPNWAATDGVVTIAVPDQPRIEVRLDQGGNQSMCAIAMIENQGGKLQVTKLVEYFAQQGNTTVHELMDRRFGFGLRWKTGSKD
jgi:tellurite resistance protein TerA